MRNRCCPPWRPSTSAGPRCSTGRSTSSRSSSSSRAAATAARASRSCRTPSRGVSRRSAAPAAPLPEGDPPQREMALGMVYMRAIELAGGLPIVLPPLGHDTIAPLLDRLCGVCLSGGPDIDPDGYGEERRNPQLGPTEPDL